LFAIVFEIVFIIIQLSWQFFVCGQQVMRFILIVENTFFYISASVGVSALFVFGFAVYNISATPRDLDWCFYVNLVAVILAFIGAILLTIYDTLLRKPIKYVQRFVFDLL
jgi:hypothetical protein